MTRGLDIPESPMLPQRLPMQKGKRLRQYLAATSVSLGAMCAGTCLAWTSPALATLTAPASPIPTSNAQSALIGGFIAIGALLAALPAGLLADRFGRKPATLLLALLFALNWTLIVFAPNAGTIIAGRFFAGLATGGACVLIPAYTSEIAEPMLRGQLGTFLNLFLTLGILVTAVLGACVSYSTLTIVLTFLPVVFGVSFYFMPESPAFLVRKDREEEARRVMQGLRGEEYDISHEMAEIHAEVLESQKHSLRLGDVLRKKAYRVAFFSVVPILAFQQLSGINVVVFYTVPIFQAAGSGLSPDLAAILIALVQFSASNLSVFIVEKAGRKIYLTASSGGMMVCLAALAMYFHLLKMAAGTGGLDWLPIAAAVLFMVFFAVGYGPVPWMLMGELFAPEVRAVGGGVGIVVNWACAFLVTYLFPIVREGVGAHVAFYACGAWMAVATVYVAAVLPETRGRTLLEIQQLLDKSG